MYKNKILLEILCNIQQKLKMRKLDMKYWGDVSGSALAFHVLGPGFNLQNYHKEKK